MHQFQIGCATLSFAVDEGNSAIFPGDMVEVDSLVVYVLADFDCRNEMTDLAYSVNITPMSLSHFALDFVLPVNMGTWVAHSHCCECQHQSFPPTEYTVWVCRCAVFNT